MHRLVEVVLKKIFGVNKSEPIAEKTSASKHEIDTNLFRKLAQYLQQNPDVTFHSLIGEVRCRLQDGTMIDKQRVAHSTPIKFLRRESDWFVFKITETTPLVKSTDDNPLRGGELFLTDNQVQKLLKYLVHN